MGVLSYTIRPNPATARVLLSNSDSRGLTSISESQKYAFVSALTHRMQATVQSVEGRCQEGYGTGAGCKTHQQQSQEALLNVFTCQQMT